MTLVIQAIVKGKVNILWHRVLATLLCSTLVRCYIYWKKNVYETIDGLLLLNILEKTNDRLKTGMNL